MKVFLFILLSLSLIGCSTVERTMSGKIGCPHGEIEILDSNLGFGVVPTTWTAKCHNQNFVCSIRPGVNDMDDLSDMDCTKISYSKNRRPLSENLNDARNVSFDEFVTELNQKSKE